MPGGRPFRFGFCPPARKEETGSLPNSAGNADPSLQIAFGLRLIESLTSEALVLHVDGDAMSATVISRTIRSTMASRAGFRVSNRSRSANILQLRKEGSLTVSCS